MVQLPRNRVKSRHDISRGVDTVKDVGWQTGLLGGGRRRSPTGGGLVPVIDPILY